jgi:hypothetical protein
MKKVRNEEVIKETIKGKKKRKKRGMKKKRRNEGKKELRELRT